MEYIAIYMKEATIWSSILVFLSSFAVTWGGDSATSFEPEKSLIRYRFLKEQKPHDKESLYDELMSLKGWVKGELKHLDVAKEPSSSKSSVPAKTRSTKNLSRKIQIQVPRPKTTPKPSSNSSRKEAFGALEKEARSAYRAKEFSRALSLYTDLIRMNPEPGHYLYRARCFKRLNRFEEAVQDYEKLDILNEPPTVGIELVRAYDQSGKTSNAISLGEQIYSKYPEFERIKLTLGILYKKEKHFQRAQPLLEEYLSINPDEPLALLEFGNLMEKIKKWPEALDIYNRLLEVDPRHKLGIRNRGNVLYRLKQYHDAAKELKASGLLHIPWVKKLYEVSLERANNQAKQPPLPSSTKILSKLKKPEPRPIQTITATMKPHTPKPTPKKEKASPPPRKPEPVVIQKVEIAAPKPAVDVRNAQAISPAKKVVVKDSSGLTDDSPGMKAFQDRKYHEAADLLRMEVRKKPLSLQLSEAYLQALQRVKNHEEIINEYERLQRVLPGYVNFDLEKKFYQISLNKFSTVLDGIPESHPSAFAHFLRSLAFNGLGQGEEARTSLEKASSLDSRFTRLDAGRFLWLVRVKNYQDAYYLGKELITNPSDWMYYEMARITWALGNGVESVLYLTKTVQIDPRNAEAFFLLAKIMHSLQRFEDRDVFIQKAQLLDPDSIEIRLWNQSLNN